MAKGKPIEVINKILSSLNTKDKILEVGSGLDLRTWTTKFGQMMTINAFPTMVDSELQAMQRDLYCCIDAIYIYLKENFKYILVNWFNDLPEVFRKKYTMRVTFFSYGLQFKLGDFLRYYCFLIATPLQKEDLGDRIRYKSRVMPMSLEQIEETFIEPRIKRW